MTPQLSFGSGYSAFPSYDDFRLLGSAQYGGSYQSPLTSAAIRQVTAPQAKVSPAGVEVPSDVDVGSGNWFQNLGGFEGFANLTKGLGSLGQIYAAFKGLRLAEDQFKFQKDAWKTDLANQTKTYNTSLEDRVRARYAQENKTSSAADTYIDQHKL